MPLTRILLLYDSIEKCQDMQKIFHKYDNIICDYDTSISIYNMKPIYDYDIIICEIQDNIPNIWFSCSNTIYVANPTSNNITEEYIANVMQNKFDICMFGPLETNI
jgi:hypothetical protein